MTEDWCHRAQATEITAANVGLAREAVAQIQKLEKRHLAAMRAAPWPDGIHCCRIIYYTEDYSYIKFYQDVLKVLGPGHFPEDMEKL